ncbi:MULTISPECIES: MFS transporter [Nonomuraea]|uniref:MFS transporter n=1 Tax=Nonomuraea mangrovi TaxID=2316207 RepID=A0ABW4STQ9_9ACTN
MPANHSVQSRLGAYRRALSGRDFRLLWLGSSLSLVGDGMTFVALTWLVLSQPGGTGRLGLLTVCYTLPVFVGGLIAGPVLDRFDKRHVLAVDSVVRGAAMASIPIAAAVGEVPAVLPFVVAGVYGLFKMVPLAGFPSAIPDLVEPEDLDAANALESLAFSLAGMVGPALGGLLIAGLGSEAVLAFDALSYAVFALTALAVRRPLAPDSPSVPANTAGPPPADERRTGGDAHGPGVRLRIGTLLRDRVLVGTTLAFMAFNVAAGMLLVVGPWLAKTQLAGGAQTLGVLLAALSAGELAGAAAAGAWTPRSRPVRTIALVQLVAATGFLLVFTSPHTIGVAAGFLVIGLFSAPMTVWAQSLRMARIPAPLRGRGFSILRTLMQATPPIGAALVTPLLGSGRLGTAAIAMALIAALPAVLLLADRRS